MWAPATFHLVCFKSLVLLSYNWFNRPVLNPQFCCIINFGGINQISQSLLGEGEVKFLERDSLACVSLLERAICEQEVTSLVGIILSFSHDSFFGPRISTQLSITFLRIFADLNLNIREGNNMSNTITFHSN